MKELQIFENKEFGTVRTVQINDEPYFVGKDVAEALGYVDVNKAVAMHVEDEDKLNDKTSSSLGQRGGWLINESGLYSLILSSKLPEAKKFKRWVTNEILPSLRKTGGYVSNEDMFINTYLPFADDQTKLLFKSTLETVKSLNEKIETDKPKVLFAEAVTTAQTDILIGELAKIIRQNGYEIGEKRLFKWLRENNYLISRQGTDYNAPTQKSIEMGLFRVKETAITHSDGHVTISKTTKVTGKGQSYFINKFLAG